MHRYEILAWDNNNEVQDSLQCDKLSDAISFYLYYTCCIENGTMYMVSLYDNTRPKSNTVLMNFSRYDIMDPETVELYMNL